MCYGSGCEYEESYTGECLLPLGGQCPIEGQKEEKKARILRMKFTDIRCPNCDMRDENYTLRFDADAESDEKKFYCPKCDEYFPEEVVREHYEAQKEWAEIMLSDLDKVMGNA